MRKHYTTTSAAIVISFLLLSSSKLEAAPKHSPSKIPHRSSRQQLPKTEPPYLAKMPRGAYLRRPAPTAASLVHQVTTDPIVCQRYEKAWGVSPQTVLANFRGVRLSRMPQPQVMKVYYFRPATGIWGYRLRRVKQGCPIFIHPDGKPFLVQVCGNPLQPVPAHSQNLPKSVATAVKDFDPQESLSADLVQESPTLPVGTDASIALAEPAIPSMDGSESGSSSRSVPDATGGSDDGGGSGGGGGGGFGLGSVAGGIAGFSRGGSGGGGSSTSHGGGSSSGTINSPGAGISLPNTNITPSGGRTRTAPTNETTDSKIGGSSTGGSSTGGRVESLSSPEPSLVLVLPAFLLLVTFFRQKKSV